MTQKLKTLINVTLPIFNATAFLFFLTAFDKINPTTLVTCKIEINIHCQNDIKLLTNS